MSDYAHMDGSTWLAEPRGSESRRTHVVATDSRAVTGIGGELPDGRRRSVPARARGSGSESFDGVAEGG
jgi:hypothetical protein